MARLRNRIQQYPWGSKTAIAQLQRRPPSDTHEAELWMGAHPLAPSQIQNEDEWVDLDHWIAKSPERVLGSKCIERFGAKLPFLMKVLAAEKPLSLQAHPSKDQAERGFQREHASGIALEAPHRNYKDPSHKPEIICALTEFEALCGFRALDQTLEILQFLRPHAPLLAEIEHELASAHSASDRAQQEVLKQCVKRLLHYPKDAQRELVHQVQNAALTCLSESDQYINEFEWVQRLAQQYPNDSGVVTAMLLNYVRLAPGQAVYLPAGNLHAYLRGTGIEVMASSDNVLRGGLTTKHVDSHELLSVLDARPMQVQVLAETPWPFVSGLSYYGTTAEEFVLYRLSVRHEVPTVVTFAYPNIVLCTQGQMLVTLEQSKRYFLEAGEAVFISANEHCEIHSTNPEGASGYGSTVTL